MTRAIAAAAGALLLVLGLDTLAFALRVADPVVTSDAWHFLGFVIRPWATGDFSFGDLFAKRGPDDHSQPLQKLVSILNYEWFDLDYRFEALVGVAFALATVALLWLMWRRTRSEGEPGVAQRVVFVSLAAVYLSIGATMAYTWPLVTMSFTAHVFILGFAWAAWRALQLPSAQRLLALSIAGFVTGIVADDVGLVTVMAIIVAAIIVSLRRRSFRPALLVTIATGASWMAYSLLYRLVSTTPAYGGSGGIPLSAAVSQLFEHPDPWGWIMAPLAASVVHRATLLEWLGTASLGSAIAVALIAAHAWFWYTALRGDREMNLLAFTAMVLMLLFYGLLAGLLLTRVLQYGTDYLWQPRYAVLYRWNLIALLLMLLGQASTRTGHATGGLWGRRIMLVMAAFLLALQLPLSVSAWKSAPSVVQYQRNEAKQLVDIAVAGHAPANCVPTLVVCHFPPGEQKQLVDFLQQQRLNVFSPRLEERLGLAAPGAASPR